MGLISPDADITNLSTENPLTVLTNLVSADFDAVNSVILEEMQSEIELIPQLAAHLISSGGKRVRPLLTLASAKLCGYKGSDNAKAHIQLAAAVEFIHTATLLHDDVVDESLMRRGNPSANALFGNQASVLVGDFLFSRAFQLMVKTGSLAALDSLSNASAVLAEGEVMQLVDHGDLDMVESRYLDIIASKTATLFESACEVGSLISDNGSDARVNALKSYGSALGICFQITDDILDYSSNAKTLGKNVGDDFREKKVTLPVIFAYQKGSKEEKEFWQKAFDLDVETPCFDSDLNQAQALLLKHKALESCYEKAGVYAVQAKEALEFFEDSLLKTTLIELVDFCLHRQS